MNNTLADIKQMFNVKAVAYNTDVSALVDGQLGFFPEGSNTSVASGTTFATLPQKFTIYSKLNGKLYQSSSIIDKSRLINAISKDYVAPVANVQQLLINSLTHIKSVALKINLSEAALIGRDGLTWQHADNVVVTPDSALTPYQTTSTVYGTYQNNVMTKILVDKINSMASPYYTAKAVVATADITVYANDAAVTGSATPVAGKVASSTATGTLFVYDGSAWQAVGANGAVTDIALYIASTKAINTDGNANNDGKLLYVNIVGTPATAGIYNDLEINYVYPRGIKIDPAISINSGETLVSASQVTALGFEAGAGYDLRAEEFECMAYYTNMNFLPRLSDGIANPNLVYQFENNKNYKTITFEFNTDKVERTNGQKRNFSVLLGTEDNTIWTALKTIFNC